MDPLVADTDDLVFVVTNEYPSEGLAEKQPVDEEIGYGGGQSHLTGHNPCLLPLVVE